MIGEIVTETGKGVFRGVGYLIAEVFFWRLCYALGWPLCKILTLGRYPRRVVRERAIFRSENAHTGFTCAAIGLLALIAAVLMLSGYWPSSLPPGM
ncbi:hypothetical protein [Alteromonas gilva]|uniref:Uncharacterized protein n=1 Tax=Alteromonas gilva TaxID=2987522 RepID=A0ABT5L557_9ALTE|nr:hypothetical protein [Alteromonas gilva]MDC8832189.1 hypothetical protein [Alteromonas gilva]